jgi:hypothetical protein
MPPSSGIDVVCCVCKLLFVDYYKVNTAYGYDTRQTLKMDLKTISEKPGYYFHIDKSDHPRIFPCIHSP